MIEMLVSKAAHKIGNNLGSDERLIEAYQYGLQILVLCLINMFLVLSTAVIFGFLETTLFFLASFIPFRAIGGGVHLKTYQRCLIIGSGLMLGASYLASIYSLPQPILIMWIGTTIFTIASMVYWVPTSNTNIEAKNKSRVMLIIAIIWFLLTSYLVAIHQWNNLLAMTLGALVSELLLSPFGFRTMESVDNYIDKIRR